MFCDVVPVAWTQTLHPEKISKKGPGFFLAKPYSNVHSTTQRASGLSFKASSTINLVGQLKKFRLGYKWIVFHSSNSHSYQTFRKFYCFRTMKVQTVADVKDCFQYYIFSFICIYIHICVRLVLVTMVNC